MAVTRQVAASAEQEDPENQTPRSGQLSAQASGQLSQQLDPGTAHTARVLELQRLSATDEAPVRISALDASGRILIWQWHDAEPDAR